MVLPYTQVSADLHSSVCGLCMQFEARQSSSPGYSMGEREEGIITLLRAAIAQGTFRAGAGQPGGAPERYLKRIRDLDPANMTSTAEDGSVVKNTFFDICCKVWFLQPPDSQFCPEEPLKGVRMPMGHAVRFPQSGLQAGGTGCSWRGLRGF